jgi:hypothetical protein
VCAEYEGRGFGHALVVPRLFYYLVPDVGRYQRAKPKIVSSAGMKIAVTWGTEEGEVCKRASWASVFEQVG